MSIELTSELEQMVRSKVDSGRYGCASDVLKDALSLLEERELYVANHGDEIREKISVGYTSLRAGQGIDGDAVFERIEEQLHALERKARIV